MVSVLESRPEKRKGKVMSPVCFQNTKVSDSCACTPGPAMKPYLGGLSWLYL